MKKTAQRVFFATVGLGVFLIGKAVLAASSPGLEISIDDMTAAGIANVSPVPSAGERFKAPVRYFRSSEKLSAADAKRDCADCADLIAVYAADVPAIPAWTNAPEQQFLKIGGRFQLKTYIAQKKRIVIVTAPSEATARKISSSLVEKFSK